MSSTDGLLLQERVDFISYTTVQAALFGFGFALYIFCARSLYLQLEEKDRRRQHLFTLVYMSLVMALAFGEIAVEAQSMQTSYVDHADYPGGGLGYYISVIEQSPISIVSNTISVLFSLMISGIQIWRLWVVWSASHYARFIVVLPVLSLFAGLALQIMAIVMVARSTLTSHLHALFYYGLTAGPLCISVIVTVSIIGRILVVRRRHLGVISKMEAKSPYVSVISMLIESFALESVWMLAQIGALSASSPAALAVTLFLSGNQLSIQLLAYLLVIYQVSTKRGWEQDTEKKLTTLEWNRDGLQTTQISTRVSIPVTSEGA